MHETRAGVVNAERNLRVNESAMHAALNRGIAERVQSVEGGAEAEVIEHFAMTEGRNGGAVTNLLRKCRIELALPATVELLKKTAAPSQIVNRGSDVKQ